jgi:3,2-trans-enoyl-CoA isomerase
MLRNLIITSRRNGVSTSTFHNITASSRLFSSVATDNAANNSEKALVKTSIDDRIATLVLNRSPVNSLSLEMCEAISTAIKDIESNTKVQGMILSSSNPSTLSAGLDLNELYSPDPERLTKFWRSFQQVFLDLYGSRLATIGAIGGNAPAAGCMLALSCDYRIMQSSPGSGPPPLIGLNEAQFGIAAPPFLGHLMLRTIGFRQGEMALSLGTLFTPEQALKIGMVDELADGDEVLSKSREVALQWTKIPPHARVASKMLARKEFLEELIRNRDEDVEQFQNFVLNDKVQANLGAYLESLRRK